MTLLDTCVAIDVLRCRKAALDLVEGLAEPPALSVITATAKTRDLELATLNAKRFPMIKGLKRAYAP